MYFSKVHALPTLLFGSMIAFGAGFVIVLLGAMAHVRLELRECGVRDALDEIWLPVEDIERMRG
jgi:hypothetical protein